MEKWVEEMRKLLFLGHFSFNRNIQPSLLKMYVEAYETLSHSYIHTLLWGFSGTWYYVNYRRHVDSEKIGAPDGIWTHDPPWSSRMLYHWATGDSVVSKGQIVGIDWNRIARLHSHVLAHMNSLTASRCHINASHAYELTNGITPSH